MIANIISSNFTIVNLASLHFLSENSTREILVIQNFASSNLMNANNISRTNLVCSNFMSVSLACSNIVCLNFISVNLMR
jgi:hypothetical protein